MKKLLCFMTVVAGGLFAQMSETGNWEVGGIGGFGFSNNLSIKNGQSSANASLAPGGAFGVFGGEDTYNYISGEARYLYRFDDLRLASGGTTVNFGGHTHLLTGDFLFHFRPRRSRVRPFVLAGGGLSVVVGTGQESAGQPLGRLAGLTATHQVLPTADFGAGFKFNLQRHLRLRLEVDDYVSARPGKVIAVAPGATASGWLNNIVAFGGISLTF